MSTQLWARTDIGHVARVSDALSFITADSLFSKVLNFCIIVLYKITVWIFHADIFGNLHFSQCQCIIKLNFKNRFPNVDNRQGR